jgi:hypothetical protein
LNACWYEITPLLISIWKNNLSFVTTLLEAGCNANRKLFMDDFVLLRQIKMTNMNDITNPLNNVERWRGSSIATNIKVPFESTRKKSFVDTTLMVPIDSTRKQSLVDTTLIVPIDSTRKKSIETTLIVPGDEIISIERRKSLSIERRKSVTGSLPTFPLNDGGVRPVAYPQQHGFRKKFSFSAEFMAEKYILPFEHALSNNQIALAKIILSR